MLYRPTGVKRSRTMSEIEIEIKQLTKEKPLSATEFSKI